MKNEIVIFENQEVKLEVNMKDETVWLNVGQIAKLFNKEESNIRRHILNIFNCEELEREGNVQKMHVPYSDKLVPFYNLDVIISVGYRVKSHNGIVFRKWATKILKEYMLEGYAINQRRLEYLEKTVKLINIANRMDKKIEGDEASQILKVIGNYSKALDLLDDYDHKTVKKIKGTTNDFKVTYEDCKSIINELKYNENSNLFALERNEGLKSIIGSIYQTFNGEDVYSSLEEKAANFLYMIVKNHVFIDGNKRIAATLFIYFLFYNDILYKNDKQLIDNNTLTAITLLIAESNPREKSIIVDLIMNFLV